MPINDKQFRTEESIHQKLRPQSYPMWELDYYLNSWYIQQGCCAGSYKLSTHNTPLTRMKRSSDRLASGPGV